MLTCLFCKTRYEKGSGISFHKFPKDNTLYLWLNNMKLEDNFYPSDNDRICSKHFTAECFSKHKSRTALKNKSIPTIFCSKMMATSSNTLVKEVDSKKDVITQKSSKRRRLKKKGLLKSNSKGANTSTDKHNSMEQDPLGTCALRRPIKKEKIEHHISCSCVPTSYKTEQNRIPIEGISQVWGNVKHDHSYQTNTPTSSKKAIEEIQNTLKIARTRIKVLSQHVKRLTTKITSLKETNGKLRKRKLIGDAFVDMLNENNDLKAQLFKRMFFNSRKNISHAGYPKELRTFALTLYAYSTNAYAYVRNKFNFALPHPRMVRSWRSALNAKTGLTESVNFSGIDPPGESTIQDGMDHDNMVSGAELPCEFEDVNSDIESPHEFTLVHDEMEHVERISESPHELTLEQDELDNDSATQSQYKFTLIQDGTEHVDSGTESPYTFTLIQDGMESEHGAIETPYKFTVIKDTTEHMNASKQRKKVTKQNRKKKNNLNFKMGDLIDNLIVRI